MDLQEIFNTTVLGVRLGTALSFVVKALLIYIFTQGAVLLVKYLFRQHIRRKGKLDAEKSNLSFFQHVIVYTLYIVGITAFLALIPGMEQISKSILAGAGIAAMAVGLASQEALKNIVSGMFIAFSKPFRIGDYIQVDQNITGTVTEITLRHTVIRNTENRMIIVPNSTMNTASIINSTIGDQAVCSFIDIGVSYTTDLNRAMQLMRAEIMKHPLLIDRRTEEGKKNGEEQVVIRVTNLGDSAITLRAWAWASSSANAYALKCDLLKSIKECFDRENIEIPYPYFNQVIVKE
ncbi:MAG: mechanosensitive ion channel family protein [Bacteroidaceae bacterium]|jgi:small conductance mechanosensitive channel